MMIAKAVLLEFQDVSGHKRTHYSNYWWLNWILRWVVATTATDTRSTFLILFFQWCQEIILLDYLSLRYLCSDTLGIYSTVTGVDSIRTTSKVTVGSSPSNENAYNSCDKEVMKYLNLATMQISWIVDFRFRRVTADPLCDPITINLKGSNQNNTEVVHDTSCR